MLKKVISIMLAVTAALLLIACKTTYDNATTAATEQSQTTAPTETTGIKTNMGVGERGDYADDSVATAPQSPSTAETEPDPTKQEETKPEETKPEETKPEETKPEETTPGTPSETTPEGAHILTYSEYKAMSVEEQEAFVDSFDTLQDFIDWWNAAKAAEQQDNNTITGDPNINLGDLIP